VLLINQKRKREPELMVFSKEILLLPVKILLKLVNIKGEKELRFNFFSLVLNQYYA